MANGGGGYDTYKLEFDPIFMGIVKRAQLSEKLEKQIAVVTGANRITVATSKDISGLFKTSPSGERSRAQVYVASAKALLPYNFLTITVGQQYYSGSEHYNMPENHDLDVHVIFKKHTNSEIKGTKAIQALRDAGVKATPPELKKFLSLWKSSGCVENRGPLDLTGQCGTNADWSQSPTRIFTLPLNLLPKTADELRIYVPKISYYHDCSCDHLGR